MFIKFASLDIIDSWSGAEPDGALRRHAHRHSFDYTPREGFIYVRSRAISSRTNDNFDTFPAEEIEKGWRTFIGKPVFVNHHNEDHKRARGVILDAALHEDFNADGSPDTWVEVLMEIDAVRFPMLAAAILAGEIDRTSMGVNCGWTVCSFCGNQAVTALQFCRHIPAMKGQKIRRRNDDGEYEDVLITEICGDLHFFENSVLVEEPADPTAYFLAVDDAGLGGGYEGSLKAASRDTLKPHGDEDGRRGPVLERGDQRRGDGPPPGGGRGPAGRLRRALAGRRVVAGTVSVLGKARADYMKLDQAIDRRAVKKAVRSLASDPRPIHSKPLKGEFKACRVVVLRGKSIRVLYRIDGSHVTIIGIGTRERFYEEMSNRLSSKVAAVFSPDDYFVDEIEPSLADILNADAEDIRTEWSQGEGGWPQEYLDAAMGDQAYQDALHATLRRLYGPTITVRRSKGYGTTTNRPVMNGSIFSSWGSGQGVDSAVTVPVENVVGIGNVDEGEVFFRTGSKRTANAYAIKAGGTPSNGDQRTYPKAPVPANVQAAFDAMKREGLRLAKFVASEEVTHLNANGGFTVSTHDDSVPRTGFMVSVPGAEEVVPLSQVTPSVLEDYVSRHQSVLAPLNRFLGGWVDNGQVYLDSSMWVGDQDRAIQVGKDNRQLAVYRLTDGGVLRLDGKPNVRQRAAVLHDDLGPTATRFFVGTDVDPSEVCDFILAQAGTTKTAALGTQWSCANSPTMRCPRNRSGKPPAKCPVCGSRIFAQQGVFGVFPWSADRDYSPEKAVATYSSEALAQKRADAEGMVVRFIPSTTASKTAADAQFTSPPIYRVVRTQKGNHTHFDAKSMGEWYNRIPCAPSSQRYTLTPVKSEIPLEEAYPLVSCPTCRSRMEQVAQRQGIDLTASLRTAAETAPGEAILQTGNPAPVTDLMRQYAITPIDEDFYAAEADDLSKAYRDLPIIQPEAIPMWEKLGALIDEQAALLRSVYDIQVLDIDPYADAASMQADIDNGIYKVTTLHSFHPVWSTETNVNFRITHDILGHGDRRSDFSFKGEIEAFQGQCEHTPVDLWPALFTEIIAQSAYANTHHLFGEQKVGLIGLTVEEIKAHVDTIMDAPDPAYDALHYSASKETP